MPKIELREFEVGDGDLVSFLEIDEQPGVVVLVAEKEENGVIQRRAIKFPHDPGLCAFLAQKLMLIGDIQQISYSKRKEEMNTVYGPESAPIMMGRLRP